MQRAPLTLPIAIAIQAPVVKLPDAISLALAAGRSGTAVGSVGNTGGSPLIYSIDNTGTGAVSLVDNSSLGVSSGFRNTSYTDPATAGAQAQYSADDFVVERPLQLTSLSAPGFVVSGTALTTAATSLCCAPLSSPARLCSGPPRRRWSRTRTGPVAGTTC